MKEAETNAQDDAGGAARGFRISAQPVVQSVRPVQQQIANPSANVGELPASYGGDFIYLIARDPKTLFLYWDLDWPTLFARASLPARPVYLRVCREDGIEESTTEIDSSSAHFYVDVALPGAQYYVELGCFDNANWRCLAHSGLAATPEAEMSADFTADFATLPLHLGFQRLLDIFRATKADRKTLSHSVARLQDRARVLRESMSPGDWSELLKAAAASANDEAGFGLTGVGSVEFSALLQTLEPRVTQPAPTAEMLEQWNQLGARFGGSSWGGDSSRNFGQSSRA